MIAEPYNDIVCLDAVTARVAEAVESRAPELVALAEPHRTTGELIAALRAKPQRNDYGDPSDGPKVAECSPIQRHRIAAEDPNCLERTADYLGAAELIDPDPVRQMATIRTPAGLHTFPLEDGHPVVLDPDHTRNGLAAGLFHSTGTRNGEPAQVTMTPHDAVEWIADIATEPAVRFERGAERVRNGHAAVRRLLAGRPLCVDTVRDVALMLALADREARLWAPMGPRLIATTVRAIDRLDRAASARWQARTCGRPPPCETNNRNALSLNIGGYRIRPDLDVLGSIGRVGGRLGYSTAIEALRLKLAAMGIAPPILTTIERELNREGLSMGALGQPSPMLGSLGAMTPQALAGRWLASKL